MAALVTVQDYIDRARVLLQDQRAPYRYPDDDLVGALDLAILEALRIRPDVLLDYLGGNPPSYLGEVTTTEVDIPAAYRSAFIYYICGHAQLRDEENTQDARASVFLNKFVAQLTNVLA